MSETKLLEMNDITKAFSSNIVLNGVKLSVNEGEVVAILGENGAGKSTLIKILGGIYKADSGEIRIHGEVKNISSAAVAGANGIRIIRKLFLFRIELLLPMYFWGENQEISLDW